ncbi:hypothetical protein GmHk_05G012497 [Glycine max]|nr:hypothetical protein GmHk_05G012497 [Glycine max]
MQVGGCSIYGGAHESSCCIPQDDSAKEVNYMGNQNRQGFHSSGFSGYQQGGNFNQNQGQGWRSHPGNQFNKDQGGPSNKPPNQGPNLYERTTKLEETLAQFMQSSFGGFGANTEKNPKEECKTIMTRSKRELIVENESRTNEEKELGAEGEKEKERDQIEERKINEDQEEENEKNTKKKEIVRRKKD